MTPTLISHYQITIGHGTSVQLFNDGSYIFTYQGKTYQSNKEAAIIEELGWKFSFSSDGKLETIEQVSVDTKYIFETIGSTARLVKSETKGSDYYIRETWDYENFTLDKTRIESRQVPQNNYSFRETIYFKRGTDLSQYFSISPNQVVDEPNVRQRIIFTAQAITPDNARSDTMFASFVVDSNGQVYWNAFYDNDREYKLLQIGTLDINPDSIAALQNKSIQGVKNLLKDDKLVAIQTVAIDGENYTVLALGTEIQFAPYNVPSQYRTQTDSQGRVTLTIPQYDRTNKVYDVKINDQGIVTLELQKPAEPPAPTVVAEHSIALQTPLSVKVYEGGKYQVNYKGTDIDSDANGVVDLKGEARIRLQFTSSGTIDKLIVLRFDGAQDVATLEQNNGTLRVAKVKTVFPSGQELTKTINALFQFRRPVGNASLILLACRVRN